MPTPAEALDVALERAVGRIGQPFIDESETLVRVENVCVNVQNRACVRLLLACLTAKLSNPSVDIRKPYTEIGDSDAYSGRAIDEMYISPFINRHRLPCNSTTAFLTPALRNIDATLTPRTELVGRPRALYRDVLLLLNDIHSGEVSPEDLLAETVRRLLVIRDERDARVQALRSSLRSDADAVPLSSETIVTLIGQHLSSPRSSRLPTLVVAAAYSVASEHLGERALPLESHTAADERTGALGDVQITFMDDNNVITAYEMKTRRVSIGDIDRALTKISDSGTRPDNYIFVTTEPIEDRVSEYASKIYDESGGIEFVVLDCIGFLRHFLHLFHRLRTRFLEAYQDLVLNEPESAVSHPLKEAFLALRLAAESGE